MALEALKLVGRASAGSAAARHRDARSRWPGAVLGGSAARHGSAGAHTDFRAWDVRRDRCAPPWIWAPTTQPYETVRRRRSCWRGSRALLRRVGPGTKGPPHPYRYQGLEVDFGFPSEARLIRHGGTAYSPRVRSARTSGPQRQVKCCCIARSCKRCGAASTETKPMM